MNIIGRKQLWFAISLVVIIPGIISLFLWGLRLSIDFTGGTQSTYAVATYSQSQFLAIPTIYAKHSVRIEHETSTLNQINIRTVAMSEEQHSAIVKDLQKDIPGLKEQEYTSIGPTIGGETTSNAVIGVLLASLLIVIYIAWSFREVPRPASSIRFGICAILALLHDVLVLVGIFSLLGHFASVEVDSLFMTAVLTVIGFSVHDTIVVFDRIRENLKKMGSSHFASVVNVSINQTLTRSLNTSLTVILVLVSLLLFGGSSTHWFIAALLIGIVSGTYSSIFNAAPLLVLWQEIAHKGA